MALFRRKPAPPAPAAATPAPASTAPALSWSPDERPWDVLVAEDGDDLDYPLCVSFDDEVTHSHEATIEDLADWLDAQPGIFEAYWEDREVILVNPGRVPRERIEQLVEAFLRDPAAPQVPRS
jgi:hypothetical protein